TAIAELASALEQWIPFAPHVAQPSDMEVAQTAVLLLKHMVAAIHERRSPQAADEAASSLREQTSRLLAAAPPPVEATRTTVTPVAVPVAPPAPEPGLPAAPVPELRKMRDDIDEQLVVIFLEEARELLPQIGSDLREWKANPRDERILQSLQRGLHTLKGSARMAGAIRLGELTHLMESAIEEAIEAKSFTPELFVQLEDKMDRLSA